MFQSRGGDALHDMYSLLGIAFDRLITVQHQA